MKANIAAYAMRRGKLILAILTAVLVGAAALSAPAAKVPAQTQVAAVGSKSCLGCHLKYKKVWPELPHSKALQPDKVGKEYGCEACHGPGAKHVKADRASIIRFRTLSKEKQDDICLKCHVSKFTAEQWKNSSHGKLGLSCNRCHDMHSPASPTGMLRAGFDKGCLCHGNIRNLAQQGKHHKLNDALQCTACHTPHGSPNPSSLVKPMGELCTGCHGK